MTPEEFAAKVDYEGGILSAMFGYGLDEYDLEDKNSRLYALVRKLRRDWNDYVEATYNELEEVLLDLELEQ